MTMQPFPGTLGGADDGHQSRSVMAPEAAGRWLLSTVVAFYGPIAIEATRNLNDLPLSPWDGLGVLTASAWEDAVCPVEMTGTPVRGQPLAKGRSVSRSSRATLWGGHLCKEGPLCPW